MKKKLIIYNMIILVCTGITTYVLLNINNQTYKFQGQFNGPINEVIDESKNNSSEECVEEDTQYNESIISEKSEDESKESKENLNEYIEGNNQIKGNRIHEDTSEYEGSYVAERKKDISVFKVDNTKIISSLTVREKATLLYIGNSLIKEDFNKLTKVLNDKNHEKAAINAYDLLKDKLSSKDFEKVKMILSKYINLEIIERKV